MLYPDAVAAFLRAKRGARRSATTIDWYAIQLQHFADWLADTARPTSLDELTAFDIDEYLADAAPALSDESLHARFRALRALCNWLDKRALIERNPMRGVEEPKRTEKPVEHVTPREYETLLRSISGDDWIARRDRLLITMLFWTGLRASELIALQAEEIYTDRSLLLVRHGKGGKARLVPIPPDVTPLLLDYLYAKPATPHLWAGGNGAGGASATPLTRSGLQQMLRRRSRAAGLRNLHPHLWRHGFGTNMLNAGADKAWVQSVLGHSNSKTTDRYARWLEEGLRNEFEAAYQRLKDRTT